MLDSKTKRAELVAFLGLGLAAVPLIGLAACQALRFAEEREYIVEALSRPTVTDSRVANHRVLNHVLTNVSTLQTNGSGGRSPNSAPVAAPM